MHELLSKLISNQKHTLEIYVAKSFALSGVYIEFCKGLKNCYVFAWGYSFIAPRAFSKFKMYELFFSPSSIYLTLALI